MTQPENKSPTFLETVLALLEERFPWLGKSEDEEVSGTDTIDRLSDLHENLAEQLAQSRSPCLHEKAAWDPVEIDYNTNGTATVSQTGICNQRGLLCRINYEPGDPEVAK